MKTINWMEKFDNEFVNPNPCWIKTGMTTNFYINQQDPTRIKNFIHETIKEVDKAWSERMEEMVKEMVGEESGCCLCDTHPGECNCVYDNYKRKQITKIAGKYGFKV